MTLSREKAVEIMDTLISEYDGKFCGLDYKNVFQLAVATILSAQATDPSVNRVTPVLFEKYPDAESLSRADVEDVKVIIKSIGLYNTKAKNIVAMAKRLVEDYGGEVPDTMEALVKLPGIGRKTANIIMSVGHGKVVGIAVDTHVFRISRRLGLSSAGTPLKVEQDLLSILPERQWPYVNHTLITHGRQVCTARGPRCGECPVGDMCNMNFELESHMKDKRRIKEKKG